MAESNCYAAVLNRSWLYEDSDFDEINAYLSRIPWASGVRNYRWNVDIQRGDGDTGIVITFTQQTTSAVITVTAAVGERLIHQVFQAGIDPHPLMIDPARVMNFVNQQETIDKFYYVPSA